MMHNLEFETLLDEIMEGEVNLKSTRYIMWVQTYLSELLGKKVDTTGIVDTPTKNAITEFRKQNGIVSTGKFDADTEAAMVKRGAVHPDYFMKPKMIHSPLGKRDNRVYVRSEMARIALEEYARWGNGTTWEDDPAIWYQLKKYWEETGYKASKTAFWSAVFVSWVIKQAGGASFFPIRANHVIYTFYAKLNRMRTGLYFRAYRVSEVRPEVGDVIVRPQEGGTVGYDDVNPSGLSSHGQIVVEVLPPDPTNRFTRIVVIGGNEGATGHGKEGGTVNKRTITLDANGYLPARPKYFTVIRLDTLNASDFTCQLPRPKMMNGQVVPDTCKLPGTESLFNPADKRLKPTLLQELMQEMEIEQEHSNSNLAIRDQLKRLAIAEWEDWGKGTIKESNPNRVAALARYYRDGIGTDDPFHKVAYPIPDSYINSIVKSVQQGKSHWSAAFISWVFRQAFMDLNIPFQYAYAHATYVRKAIEATKKNDPNYPFRIYKFNEVKPEVGDLICNTRDASVTYESLLVKGYPILHCNIIVDVNEIPGLAHGIGGNAGDSYSGKKDTVGKAKIALNKDGFIVQRSKNPYLALIRFVGFD